MKSPLNWRSLAVRAVILSMIALSLQNAGAHASPASRRAYTSPETWLGNGGYYDSGSSSVRFTVCDTFGDYRRVVADFAAGGSTITLQDADGANGVCFSSGNYYIREGTPIYAMVCRQNGGDPRTRDKCGSAHLGYS